jgi:hypothetical protein
MRKQQDDGVAEALEFACPALGGSAGLEEDCRRPAFGEELGEAEAQEAVAFADVAGMDGDSDLKNLFHEIACYSRMINMWTPPFGT